ncbi:hypothetical protein C8R43DRAFT_951550 [Mycena crocata]|nr:hypothetical protein C8R43DRAFT_951550 [Mycena crocata]
MEQNIQPGVTGVSHSSLLAEDLDLGLINYRYIYMTEHDRQAANVKHKFAEDFLRLLVAAYRLCGAGDCYGTAMLLVIETPHFIKFLRKNDRQLFVHHTCQMLKVKTLNLSPNTVLTWLKIFVELDIYSKLFHRRVRRIPAQMRNNVLKWTLGVKNETARRIYTNNQGDPSNVAPNELRENCVVAVKQQLIVAKLISSSTGRDFERWLYGSWIGARIFLMSGCARLGMFLALQFNTALALAHAPAQK